jgi:transcriptional regulator with XRE-family HTH domain
MDDTSNRDRDSFHSPEFGRALGRTIKVMRTDQGLGRREFAERVGISYSYVTEIENGDKPASSKVLAMIAGALGMRLHELIAQAETRAAAFERERETLDYPSPAAQWGEAIAPPSARGPRPRGQRPASAPQARVAAPALDSSSSLLDPIAPGYSYAPRTPRSLVAVMRELQDLLRGLEPDDVERVLDLARRLTR